MNKRLLFSAVLAATLGANEANAQKVELPTAPTPTELKLDGTDTVYLYNVKAQKFLAPGGNWKTTAVFKDKGVPFAIVKGVVVNDQAQTYVLWDKSGVSGKATWTKFFIDSANEEGGASFCDYNNQKGDWKTNFVIHKKGVSFELQADTISAHLESAGDLAALGDTRAGWKNADDLTDGSNGDIDNKFRPTLPTSDANYASYGVEWQAVSLEEGEKFSVRITLANAINEAVDEGVDVSAQVAVYNNSAASLEELNAAVDGVKAAVRNKKITEQNPSVDNPVDLSEFVNNLNCESAEGWDIVGKFDSNGNKGDGGHGFIWRTHSGGDNYVCPDDNETIGSDQKFLERWVSRDAEMPSDPEVAGTGRLSNSRISQTLKHLPAGAYSLKGYFYGTYQGSTEKQTGLYAFMKVNNNEGDASDSIAISNLENQPGLRTLTVIVPEDGTLEFGCSTYNTSCNHVWMKLKELQYYGAGDMVKFVQLQNAIDAAQDKTSEYVYAGYITALQEAIDAAQAVVDNKESDKVNAATEALNKALSDVTTNLKAYENLDATYMKLDDTFQELDDAFEKEVYESFIEGRSTAYPQYTEPYDNIANDRLYDTPTVNQYIEDLQVVFKQMLRTGIKPGHEVPSILLADPSFENGGSGWEGKQTVNSTYQNCEAYAKTFDMYQVLKDIPNGVYTVSVQAFQRVGNNATAYPLHQQGPEAENITTYVYGNEVSKKVCSTYDYAMSTKSEETGNPDWTPEGETDVYYVNSMQAFKKACDEDGNAYLKSVNVIVTDGTLRFGIRCEQARESGYWSIWDNFKLTYAGDDYSAVLADIQPDAQELLNSKMSADSLNALSGALQAAQAAATGDNVTALARAISAARSSVEAYKTFRSGIDEVIARYNDADARSEEAKGVYEAALATAENGYATGSVKDAEITDALQALKKGLVQYLVYDDAKAATVSSPKDISYVMSNASFTTMDKTGWTINKGSAGFQASNNVEEMEFYNCDFDFNQVISGLPAGRYELTVRGFYREGTTQNVKDSLEANNLKNYASVFINGVSAPMQSVYVGATKTSDLESVIGLTATTGLAVWDNSNEEDIIYVPNDMIRAQAFFGSSIGSLYDTKVSYYTAEPVDITVGGVKTVKKSNDWTIFKSFKLVYMGNDATGIENISGAGVNGGVVGTKIYNVNGVETGALQQGLNIVKTTMSDGTVRVKKIMVGNK